jgi:hypothetical protein
MSYGTDRMCDRMCRLRARDLRNPVPKKTKSRWKGSSNAYRVGSVAVPLKVHHAVETGERGAIALVAMGIEFLLSEDIPTILLVVVCSQCLYCRCPSCPSVGQTVLGLRGSNRAV